MPDLNINVSVHRVHISMGDDPAYPGYQDDMWSIRLKVDEPDFDGKVYTGNLPLPQTMVRHYKVSEYPNWRDAIRTALDDVLGEKG